MSAYPSVRYKLLAKPKKEGDPTELQSTIVGNADQDRHACSGAGFEADLRKVLETHPDDADPPPYTVSPIQIEDVLAGLAAAKPSASMPKPK